jgi:hypothetical protein
MECTAKQSTSQPSAENIPFWSENPNALLNPAHITEFFPSDDMTYNQKLNAITRAIILLSLLLFVWTQNPRSVLFCIASIFAIYLVHYYQSLEKKKSEKRKDAFTGLTGQNKDTDPAFSVIDRDLDGVLAQELFDTPSPNNPFSNVLVSDINDNPSKKPAPPAYNDITNKTILAAAKEAVIQANPDQPEISEKLFMDLGEQLTFEQSMRQFYSNPSTTTPDDQKAFAEFCYGSMISCAEGNKFACARNAAAMRHTF